ncbi:MAG: ornithine cyclodeaminase family protein, partial [Actinomycetota bacterium]
AAADLAEELGWEPGPASEALRCDVVTLVTPGTEPVVHPNDLHPGMHLNALGADGPGKAEMEVDAVVRCDLFCDEWTQASHGGELTAAAERGLIAGDRVTELGDVLAGTAGGRASEEAITLFDSTGLAIQDLAIVRALLDRHASGEVEARDLSL